MSEETKDETSSFVVTNTDYPVVEEKAQETKTEEQAKPEVKETEVETKTEDKSNLSGDDATAEQDQGKKHGGVQKRIDKVVREREEAKRRAEAAEKKLKELEGKTKEETKPTAKKPREHDFDTYDEFLDALDDFENGSAEDNNEGNKAESKDKSKDESKGEAEEPEISDQAKTAIAVLKEKVDSAEKPDDFNDVAYAEDLSITQDMVEALSECDNPDRVLYHLGKNKELATEIAGKSKMQQFKEVLRLDMTVKASKPPKPTKTTAAPDPISPVHGSDAQEKDISEMTQAEYEAWANKQELKRGTW